MTLSSTKIGPKILSVLRADATLLLTVTSSAMKIGPVNPTGRFPCIIVEIDEDESENVLPAMHGTAWITPWCDLKSVESNYDPIKKLCDLGDRILTLLDGKWAGAPLTDGDNIRVVHFKRISGPQPVLYDDKLGKYKAPILFEFVMSYHESGLAAGDVTWE